MIRKNTLPTILSIALIISASICQAQVAKKKTNFVFIIADDISQDDLGCYGHPVIKTPHIDQLAANGLRCTNAYVTISSCSPSRCSIITGRYPHNTGAAELHTKLPEGSVLFPKLLKDAGYYTALSGKHHMGKNADPGFTTISKGKGPGLEGDWVDILKNRPQDQPFFCWFAASDAHRGWSINDEAPIYQDKDVIIPPYLVDGPKTRADLTGYYHEVSRFDHYVGRVVEELKRQKILQHTLIIIMSDNGRPFPRCKTRLYDSGCKTPFVMHYPAGLKTGVSDSLISAIDVSATILEIAEIKKDPRIQGVSLTPVMADPAATTRDVVFSEHNWHVYRNHERLVRMGNWLYIRNNIPDQQNLCVEAYIGGAGEELWDAHKAGTLTPAQQNIFLNPCPGEELYHVGKDPHQLNNLASNPENEVVLKSLRKQLAQWTKQTGDNIPEKLTPHRDSPPGQPKRSRKDFKHGEMPGLATGAIDINHPGPIKLGPTLKAQPPKPNGN